MLVKALAVEVAPYRAAHMDERDEQGHTLVVCNKSPGRLTCADVTLSKDDRYNLTALSHRLSYLLCGGVWQRHEPLNVARKPPCGGSTAEACEREERVRIRWTRVSRRWARRSRFASRPRASA